MKKIVALVLCLVLALSLCTVAFADVTSTTKKASDGYQIWNAKNELVSKDANGKAVNLTETVTGNATDADGTVTYTATSYNDGTTNYYKVAKDAGEYKLVKNGVYVCTLAQGTTATTQVKLDSYVVVAKAGTDCGAAKATYGVAAGKYYADDTSWAIYNGEFVSISATASTAGLGDENLFVQHDFTKKAYTFNAKGEKVSVACDKCKASFEVVGEKCAKAASDVTYTGSFKTIEAGVTALLGGAAAGNTTDKTVESAKTFDAGIALYAGMALASVAGSAVVIGKKKEF